MPLAASTDPAHGGARHDRRVPEERPQFSLRETSEPRIVVIDDFMDSPSHQSAWKFLNEPGWGFGAYSDGSPNGSRYLFKHYAGYVESGSEERTPAAIEDELVAYPAIARIWEKLKAGPLNGRPLARCYANGMPPGAEGGLHMDSNIPTHFTALYYPHLEWRPHLGGETLFFRQDGSDLVGAVYPKPNRMVLFSGTIPHVARPISMKAQLMRITLMFKTCG